MNENKTIQYKIVNKNGEIIEDEAFNDYDKLADHMMELADKWYSGLYDTNDSLEISTFDKSGDLIYSDKATFGETMNDESNFENTLEQLVTETNEIPNTEIGD